MKKRLLLMIALVCGAVLLLQGFALPALSPVGHLLLRLIGAAAVQGFFLSQFRHKALQMLPHSLCMLFALWGAWLLLTSDSWRNATLVGYLIDYVSPAAACTAVCLAAKLKK